MPASIARAMHNVMQVTCDRDDQGWHEGNRPCTCLRCALLHGLSLAGRLLQGRWASSQAQADSGSTAQAQRTSDVVAGTGHDRSDTAATWLRGRAVDVVDPARVDQMRVWPDACPVLGQSNDVVAGHHGSVIFLPWLATRPRASSEVGNRGVSCHQVAGITARRDDVLWRRGGYPFGLPHGHDFSTGGADARGDGHRSTMLSAVSLKGKVLAAV